MSEESVETVRSIYEAFNRRDWDEAFLHQHPDVEMTTPPGINAGTFRGREEIQRFWEEILSAFESTFAEPEQLVASGDQVVAVVRSEAQPRDTSAKIEIRNGHVWTFRNGKVASMEVFPEPEAAFEAAEPSG